MLIVSALVVKKHIDLVTDWTVEVTNVMRDSEAVTGNMVVVSDLRVVMIF